MIWCGCCEVFRGSFIASEAPKLSCFSCIASCTATAMAHILDLPDELLLEIVHYSNKNLHLTCKLLHAIGFSHFHPSLNSPLRKAIAGDKAARLADQDARVREYKQTVENLFDVEYKVVAVT